VSTRDYSGTPLAKKLGVKEGSRVAIYPPEQAYALEPLPPGAAFAAREEGLFDVILFFTTEARELAARFTELAGALTPAGGLWIAWPKKASAIPSDLSFADVQRVGLEAGLVDNKSCSIDASWQALRFVYRLADRPRR
jgi:hypothetical protein